METNEALEHAKARIAEHLIEITSVRALTLETIVPIAINLMTFIEGYDRLTGGQKKELIVNTLNDFVGSNVEGDVKRDIQVFISLALPGLIDRVIDLDTGKIKIKVKITTPPCLHTFIRKVCCVQVK